MSVVRTHNPDNPDPSAAFVEEQGWVARIRSGDHAAFKALYDRYADVMFAFAYSSLRSRDEAQDVVQDIFLNVWKNRSRWELTTSIRAYLMRGVFNRVATLRRHLRVELAGEDTIVREADESGWAYRTSADRNLDASELAEALERAVSSLPPRAQQAYRLVREQHMSYVEAAHVMGITPHTLEQHMMKALKSLRNDLAGWRHSNSG
jgi:RNA polymerase sigma-70 factor, ECF subfamily